MDFSYSLGFLILGISELRVSYTGYRLPRGYLLASDSLKQAFLDGRGCHDMLRVNERRVSIGIGMAVVKRVGLCNTHHSKYLWVVVTQL